MAAIGASAVGETSHFVGVGRFTLFPMLEGLLVSILQRHLGQFIDSDLRSLKVAASPRNTTAKNNTGVCAVVCRSAYGAGT